MVDLEYMTIWQAALLFAALAAPILFLGMRSMAGLGPVRKWTAIALRLLVLLVLVLIVGGARWKRVQKSVEVMVLRDISDSTQLFRQYPGKNLQESLDDYLRAASEDKLKPGKDDKIGVISFAEQALVDSMPNSSLLLEARGVRERTGGTDIASAVQLALATSQRDSMRRLVVVSDFNQTSGDLEGALAAAVSQHVPIDVMPLNYAVQNEVMVQSLLAPSIKRENDAFDIFVPLLSTNTVPVTGKLTIFEEDQPIEKRAITIEAATINAEGKIEPRKHVERVKIPPLKMRTVRRFTAQFDPDVVNSLANAKVQSQPGDTLLGNNRASAFTLVRGQGRVLYVDASKGGSGKTLADVLAAQGVQVQRVGIDQVPEDLVGMQNYDAIILNNVARGRTPLGADGVTEKQVAALASYVHDFGGGLVMIGGENSFGAGGWQGSKVEDVMPVNFDIPAQRQMPKGALVLIIHSCEMKDGNYWGEQCAIKAVETLSSQDEVGVISFNWGGGAGGGGVGGSVWDFPLYVKGDGSRPIAAIKKMTPLDMPSFDDCLQLAVNGAGPANAPCLKNSNAAQKHIIIISDGDPQAPKAALLNQIIKSKITISTVTVFPHGGISGTMKNLATATGGRFYGPIDQNPGQLPQIFIKEAAVVRRTLLQESREPPIAVTLMPNNSDIMKGILPPPPIYGLVLSARKNNPTIEMPLVASLDGKKVDPLFAHWQAGLGKAAAFASDGAAIWDEQWLSPQYMGTYGKFWLQVVRGVSRPPMSGDFTVNTERQGDKAIVTVEATNKESGFASFLNMGGVMLGPDNNQQELRLVQTGPGTYVGEFTTGKPGNYVVSLTYSGPNNQQGWLVTGTSVNDSPEMRELKSNEVLAQEIATRTGGRVLPVFNPEEANLFSRKGLTPGSSPLPIWDILIPILLGLVLMDVACRRIAWDWESTKKLAAAMALRVRQYTLTREVKSEQTLDALKRVRDEVAETKFKQAETPAGPADGTPRPDRSAKFEAKQGVEGDITQVVGGATSKPVPGKKAPEAQAPAEAGAHTSSLLEAKRRAQQKIREKEQGDQ